MATTLTIDEIRTRLSPMSTALEADGYLLEVAAYSGTTLETQIVATDAACTDCLVPKAVMSSMIEKALEDVADSVNVTLRYPSD